MKHEEYHRACMQEQPAQSGTNCFTAEMAALLDSAYEILQRGDVINSFRILSEPLTAIWMEASNSIWAEAVKQQCRSHPLHQLVHRDPYTFRAAVKPRGYAGDAVMMDYIYHNERPSQCDELGGNIFSITTRLFTSLSVRYRRQLLRSLIDDTVARSPSSRILSVASGHARELTGSLVTSELFSGEFVAMDQDLLSCAEIERAFPSHRIRTLNLGVIELLKGKHGELGRFDLIYSAGLYDYLSDTLSRRLTRHLLQMLAPGGRLLLANFIPQTSGRGYMELFMDWHLVYRNEQQMLTIARDAGATSLRSFLDPHRNVVYVEITREAAMSTVAA